MGGGNMECKSILDYEIFDISHIVDFSEIIQIIDIIKGTFDILAENTSTIIKSAYDKTEDKIYYLQPNFFESTTNTLKSILICARIGNIIDSHVLVRKLRDDLFQWLYLLSAIEKNDDLFNEALEKEDLSIYESNMVEINNIGTWFKNIIHHKNYTKLRKDEYEYNKYLKSLSKIKELNNYSNIIYQNHLLT